MRKRSPRPITDITSRSYPQLGWVYDPHDRYGHGPLHIADKNCRQDGDYRSLARCGRAIRFQYSFNNGIYKGAAELTDFRLCRSCGNETEFAEALEAHKSGHAQSIIEYKARRAAEDAIRDEENAERAARTDRLKRILNVGRFIEDRQYLIAFEHEGFRYYITEDGAIKEPKKSQEAHVKIGEGR